MNWEKLFEPTVIIQNIIAGFLLIGLMYGLKKGYAGIKRFVKRLEEASNGITEVGKTFEEMHSASNILAVKAELYFYSHSLLLLMRHQLDELTKLIIWDLVIIVATFLWPYLVKDTSLFLYSTIIATRLWVGAVLGALLILQNRQFDLYKKLLDTTNRSCGRWLTDAVQNKTSCLPCIAEREKKPDLCLATANSSAPAK